MKRIVFVLVLLLGMSGSSRAQHLYDVDLYDFLDELASSHAISLNTAVKPYTRELMEAKLLEASWHRELLNTRQQRQLEWYAVRYHVSLVGSGDTGQQLVHTAHSESSATNTSRSGSQLDWVYYSYTDSLFYMELTPAVGYSFSSNDSGNFYRRWGGAVAYGRVGKHLSFSGSLRDHHEGSRLSSPEYLNQFPTSNYKPDNNGGGDYDETRGFIRYGWKWGSASIVMDQIAWGDNYHGSNLLSGRAPVFPSIQFEMTPCRWLEFHYFHAWLKSDEIDSARIYSNGTSNRLVMRPKYLASDLLTVTPFSNFRFSVGNSIVYSDEGVNPAYLIPFLFYKSADRSLNGYSNLGNQLGENSQLFFNVSSRNIRNLHLYGTLFIDELALGDAFDKDKQSNFISFKVGGRASNLILENLFLTAEATLTRPVTYRHYISTADYTSSSFGLGHYLGDNSREFYLSLGYKPSEHWWAEVSWTGAEKGPEYPYTGQSGTAGSGKGLPFLEEVLWESSDFEARVRYQPVVGAWVFAGVLVSDHSGSMDEEYSQPYFRGQKTTLTVGANIGF